MDNIEKLAIEFLESDFTIEADASSKRRRRKSRLTIQRNYDNLKRRYLLSKQELDLISEESRKLKDKYDKLVAKTEEYHRGMMKLREHLALMDDEGHLFLDLSEQETPEGFEDEPEGSESETSGDIGYDPYHAFR